MRYIKNPNTDPYFNMAFDEYCLNSLTIDEPVFFLWQNRPSVIIGFNQEVNTEVNLEFLRQNDISLVRRVTGGGAVYHDLGNLNYTIVGRSEDLERDYPEYAGLMMKALQKLEVPATLSGRNDILVHGTLMFDVNLEVLTQALCPPATKLQSKGIASVRSRVTNLCEHLPHIADIQAFSQKLEEILSCQYEDEEYKLSTENLSSIQQLADEKFSRWEWNYGHSPKATLTHSARLKCGTVEVHLILTENRIATCRFGGDFLGNLPASEVESALKGVAYEANIIRECLLRLPIEQYFDGVKADELVGLMIG